MSKIRKKSPIHENADANITCDFGDGEISRLGVAYQTHVYIHDYLDYKHQFQTVKLHPCLCCYRENIIMENADFL